MSESKRRPVTLGAGHARKPTGSKAAKAGTKAVKADEVARGGAEGRSGRSLPGAGAVTRVVGRVVAVVMAAPRHVWGVWERGYDAVSARPAHAVRVFAVLVAAVAVLGGLFWWQTDRWSRSETARAEATQAGEAATEQLLSYSFRSVDRQVEKARELSTGSFRDEYAKYISESVAPKAKDKQAIVRVAVDRSAVVDAGPGEVTLLVFFEQQSELGGRPEAVASGINAVRVTLEKEDDRWKVSELTPV